MMLVIVILMTCLGLSCYALFCRLDPCRPHPRGFSCVRRQFPAQLLYSRAAACQQDRGEHQSEHRSLAARNVVLTVRLLLLYRRIPRDQQIVRRWGTGAGRETAAEGEGQGQGEGRSERGGGGKKRTVLLPSLSPTPSSSTKPSVTVASRPIFPSAPRSALGLRGCVWYKFCLFCFAVFKAISS